MVVVALLRPAYFVCHEKCDAIKKNKIIVQKMSQKINEL